MATSLGMVFGTLGGFMSPYVIEIKQQWGPYAVFGGISLLGSVSKLLGVCATYYVVRMAILDQYTRVRWAVVCSAARVLTATASRTLL